MINRVVLVGRLTKDPELKYTPNGVAVANFTLAVNRPFANQQGEREADFINCIIWRKQAENVANYLRKGSLAGLEGRIQTRSFDDSNGQRQFRVEVVGDSVQFLEPRNASGNQGSDQFRGAPAPMNQGQGGYGGQQQNQNRNQSRLNDDPFANDGNPIDISDDDLPF
ncbi:single-stranded DNA-binding protein [Bacillus sp. FJAT-45350]|uniref:single-stranded DNA-binding protein n=1 Tax=Bacillus sp. FJAT-45350 TaxID=2011014 RepID=UPI000BB9838E|nr:single-stranded DNA-binding protein [Bacillus sp. FJAT-45350]